MNLKMFFNEDTSTLILFILGVLFTGFIISYTLQKCFVLFMNKKFPSVKDDLIKKSFSLPLKIFISATLWIKTLPLLNLNSELHEVLLKTGDIILTVAFVTTVYLITDYLFIFLLKRAQKSTGKFDDILIPFLEKTVKFLIILVGVVVIGKSLSFDVKGLVAGMGIGGLAIAMASKDTIANLFGSFTIIFDKPFQIGDWVYINDSIEGTVECVGIRSTRIRTFYDSLITVPNGQLTNVHIENYEKRTYRRFSTKLSIEYGTPIEKIELFCEEVKKIILRHEYTRKDYFHVYCNNMSSSSIDILLYCFWKVPDWTEELKQRHHLLIDILKVAKSIDVQFAFPTQTLHLFNNEKPNS